MSATESTSGYAGLGSEWGGLSPEATGERDGKNGIPWPQDQFAHFEQTVLERLEAGVAELEKNYKDEETPLATHFQSILPTYTAAWEILESRKALAPYASYRITHKLALPLSVALSFLCAIVNAYEFYHAGWGAAAAMVFGVILATVSGVGSYLSGFLFQLSRMPLGRLIPGLLLFASLAVVFVVVAAFDHSSLSMGLRLALATLDTMAIGAICLLSFLSHDPYWIAREGYEELRRQISSVATKRRGLRERYIHEARMRREEAQEMIRRYRQANLAARCEGTDSPKPVPAFFQAEPDVPDISIDSFCFNGDSKQMEGF